MAPVPQTVSKKPKSEGQPSLAEIQAKLKAANDEKGPAMSEVTTLQQEEEVSISGSNARLMIMQKLSRKSEVCYNVNISYYCLFLQSKVVVLRNMVTVEDIDDDLEDEVTSECSRYGNVNRVLIYQEKQGIEEDAEVVVKIFVIFHTSAGKSVKTRLKL